MSPDTGLRTLVSSAAATAAFIQAVSLFDDLLDSYLLRKYPEAAPRRFVNRVEFLAAKAPFKDSGRVFELKEKRDSLAHDANSQITWMELHDAFVVIESELII
jgi:hypothetical protein